MSRFINDVKTTNEKFTGNEYYGNGVFVWRGTQYNTLALWRAASGQERTGGKWIRCSARRMRALLTAVPITDRALLIHSPVRHCASLESTRGPAECCTNSAEAATNTRQANDVSPFNNLIDA